MALLIERRKHDLPFDKAHCFFCTGRFYYSGFVFEVYELENDEWDFVGESCDRCAAETEMHLRELLLLRSNDERTVVEQTEYRLQTYKDLIEEPESSIEYINKDIQWRKVDIELSLKACIEFAVHAKESIERPQLRSSIPHNGYVYLLGSPEGYCKIGRTKEMTSRLLAIGLQLPFRVELLHSIRVSDPVGAERELHKRFASCRMNGEWFLLSDTDITWIKSLATLET